MAPTTSLDLSTLKAFENAAAGHDGVMSDASGELFIKPCTQSEIDFYQTTQAEHVDFAELIPAFVGTLQLGAPPAAAVAAAVADAAPDVHRAATEQAALHGANIAAHTAIVLENLEHGFIRPNVLDIKLGARLHADGTAPEKAARLDRVAAETTSGSLHFRVAGMKVWDGVSGGWERYDRLYGRRFDAQTVHTAFATFFAPLIAALDPAEARAVLETVLADVTKLRHTLERAESRMYSASVLVVYEGDGAALRAAVMGRDPAAPLDGDERAPTRVELEEAEDEDGEDEDELVSPFTVRMIDFAHSQWTPGAGKDDNVIVGLGNVEKQLDMLIATLD